MSQGLTGKSGSNISEDAIINIKQSDILEQLHENIRNELSDQIFGIISYSPLKFIIANKTHKQILYSNIKKKKNNNKDTNNDDSEFGFHSETEANVPSLNLSKIIINAIPIEITKREDALGFNTQQKYTIKFETPSRKILVIKTKTIEEIIYELKSKALLFLQVQGFRSFIYNNTSI